MEALAFWILAIFAVGTALVVVLGRKAVICGLALALHLVTIAAFFLTLGAQFIAFLQVIVYAGAIMVLILFVLMLLNVQDEERMQAPRFFQKYLGFLVAAGFVLILAGVAWTSNGGTAFPEASSDFGTIRALGSELFTRYFYPFEAISILLVVAMVGAVLLAKKRL